MCPCLAKKSRRVFVPGEGRGVAEVVVRIVVEEVQRRVRAAQEKQAGLKANELPDVQQQLAAITKRRDEALRKREDKVIVNDGFDKPYTQAYSVFLHDQEVQKCYNEAEDIKHA